MAKITIENGAAGAVIRAAINDMFTELYAKFVAATAEADGYLTKEDFATFLAKQDALVAATAEADGYLKKEDFAVFLAKQDALSNGVPFRKTVTLTAAAAATPVHVLPEALVAAGQKAFITNILLFVSGETAWTDELATGVSIQDTEAAPILAVSFAKAQLTGGAILGMHSAGVTLARPVLTGVGLTAGAGIDIAADGNFAAGSDIIVTVCGFIE